MKINPDLIHIMKPEYTTNLFEGVITKRNTVEFGDGEFEADITQLYPGSYIDDEEYLVKPDGLRLDMTGVEVEVEVPISAVSMSDDENVGGAHGNIISLIYKGDHYNYIVRTENEEDFVINDEYLWNEGDYVSVVIAKEDIKLKLKNVEE
jgi:spermidine/putrescine transport system ATP-binding protein